ncbi:MAG: murein biosynthesis integral membrane protein MurJ [Campylobacterales bacterium]
MIKGRLGRAIATNSSGILASRLTGFARDMTMASILGANIWSDIFFVAFKFPNLFRSLFAEGAFSQAFIPSYAASRHKSLFSAWTLSRLLMIILFLSLIITLFAREAAYLLAWGFSPENLDRAAPLIAINFYYLDLIFVMTFLAALLQYRRHFATTAFSTALLNLSMIAALFLAHAQEAQTVVWYLSWGVLAGGVLQVAVHLWAAKKRGIVRLLCVGFARLWRGEKASEDSRRFIRGFLPSMIGSSTQQLSAFIDTILGTFLVAGSISWLYYANRIFQLPLALFAIATATALFPMVARAIANNDEAQALQLMAKSFWLLLLLLSLAALGGIILSQEIIWLLFERGAFDRTDTLETAFAMQMYLLGLIPFGLAKIFNLWLYAHHRQAEAAKISALALGGNILLSLLLFKPLGAGGLALAGSLTGVVLLTMTTRLFGWGRLASLLLDRRALWLIAALIGEALLLYPLHLWLLSYLGL